MEITLEPGYEDRAELEQLFGEYMDMLLCRQPDFQGYLALQHYDTELEQLREKYGPPDGRLYLARADGAAAGCVALRRIDGESCELKRLYVRPAFRGHGLAGRLVDQVIADARDAGYRAVLLDTFPFLEDAVRLYKKRGYRAVLLDTFPFLEDAVRLYKKRGFREVPSYNGTPMEQLIYLRLDLEQRD